MKSRIKRRSITGNIMTIVFVAVALGMSAIAIFSGITYRRSLIGLKGEEAVKIASMAATAIEGDSFKRYDETGIKDNYYFQMLKMLDKMKGQAGIRYLYTFVDNKDNTNFKYIAEAALPGETADDGIKQLGDLDNIIEAYDGGAEPLKVLKTGIPTPSDVYSTQEYGELISGYAPIYNSTGAIVGVAGADIDISAVNQQMAAYLPVLIAFMLGAVMVVVLAVYLFNHSQVVKPLRFLSDLSGKAGEGISDISVPEWLLKRRDELGELSKALNIFLRNMARHSQEAEEVAHGNIRIEVSQASENDSLARSMKDMIATLEHLMAEVQRLTEAALGGNLKLRGDTESFAGEYRELLLGVNRLLDAMEHPVEQMREAARASNLRKDYQEAEVHKLLQGLEALSKGNLGHRYKANEPGDESLADYVGIFRSISKYHNDSMDAISRYIKRITEVLSQMAVGNFGVSIEDEFEGDFVELKDAINVIGEYLSTAMEDVKVSADQVESSTLQLSASNQAFSQGTTEQAGAIEELTASITQIASQSRESAANASRANAFALAAKESAADGNTQIKEMQLAMAGINEASENIYKVIKVIDDIAFQTNMLALNAAVEAARAGQHGKGFAVVAEEVRNLAQRSANAAKETTAMIEESIIKAKTWDKVAGNTAHALTKIIDSVNAASDLVNDIAAASNEQSTAVAQVNKGIEQVSKVVQMNSATAEESAAASEELSGQAVLLKEMVGRFSLRGQNETQRQKILTQARPRS